MALRLLTSTVFHSRLHRYCTVHPLNEMKVYVTKKKTALCPCSCYKSLNKFCSASSDSDQCIKTKAQKNVNKMC